MVQLLTCYITWAPQCTAFQMDGRPGTDNMMPRVAIILHAVRSTKMVGLYSVTQTWKFHPTSLNIGLHWQWCLDEVSRRENRIDLPRGSASTADHPSVSVYRSVLQSLVSSLVLSRLDYGSATHWSAFHHISCHGRLAAAVSDEHCCSAYILAFLSSSTSLRSCASCTGWRLRTPERIAFK